MSTDSIDTLNETIQADIADEYLCYTQSVSNSWFSYSMNLKLQC